MTNDNLTEIRKWIEENFKEIKNVYFDLLKIPSISGNEKYFNDICRCSLFLKKIVDGVGLKTEIIDTETSPIVFGEYLSDKKDSKTLLIYGHYDVTDVAPIEDWLCDPFDPYIKDNQVFARGALDNKGQLLYSIYAIKCLMDLYDKKLPINIKICLEGEEEATSYGLSKSLKNLKKKFRADYLLVPDTDIPNKHTPAITLGLRGVAQMTVDIIGSNVDLHSGTHGGLAYNPLRAMVEMLSKIWDENGKILIDGFYEGVEDMKKDEMDNYFFDFDKELYSDTFGIKTFGGEKKYSELESNWLRPTIEINGIRGGSIGKEHKTVIPAKAHAKISCRLVPNQDPKKIIDSIRKFFQNNVKKGMDVVVTSKAGGIAVRENADNVFAKAVSNAYTEVFGKKCKKILSGGSIPIISDLKKELGVDIVMMGFGLAEDNMHGPNEHFGLDRFKDGILTVARTIQILGKNI